MTDSAPKSELPPNSSDPGRPPTRRRFLSFSLRTLLIVTTLCAIGLFAKRQYDFHQRLKMVEKATRG
jgi:hypothetical protein